MSDDPRARHDEDAELRALFRARAARAGAAPVPSFDAVVSRRFSQAVPRSVAVWRVAGIVVAAAVVAAVVLGVLPESPRHGDHAIALPAIRMPSDALLAAAPLPRVDGAWSSLPTAVLGRAPIDPVPSPTR